MGEKKLCRPENVLRFPSETVFFSQLSERPWGPPAFISEGYRGLVPRGRSDRGVKFSHSPPSGPLFFSPMARQPLFGCLGLLITEASRSHTLDTPHSVGLLWTSDQPVAETST